MGFLRNLFKKAEKRALHFGASVSDDYDWTKYSEEYQRQIAKMSKILTLHLSADNHIVKDGEIHLNDGLLPLHKNHKCIYETIYTLEPSSIIEVGCGGGDHLRNLSVLLPDVDIRGFDRDKAQLAFLAHRSPELADKTAIIDLTKIPEPMPEPADIVYSQAVIMHIHEGDGHLNALSTMCNMANRAVILMENWHRHAFMADLISLHQQGRLKNWATINFYLRRAEGKPHMMVVSPHELDLEPLDNYDQLL